MREQLQLDELLKQCTVRLSVSETSLGTGFFVAPGMVLTCAHVVKTAREKSIAVEAYLWDGASIGMASIQKFLLDEITIPSLGGPLKYLYPDLALLQVDQKNHPCVYFDTSVRSGDVLLSFGYTQFYPHGDTSRFTYVGESQIDSQRYLLQFQGGLALPGLSGAPLLNLRTGLVCGIVQKNRSLEKVDGGRGVPTSTILNELQELKKPQQMFHQKDKRWFDCQTPQQRQQSEGVLPTLASAFTEPIEIFVSYVSTDEALRSELAKHLKQMVRERLITIWYADNTEAGLERKQDAKVHLDSARIILLLVSPDFLDSDYHYDFEMARALERHKAGTARVIPIILRQTEGWAATEFQKLQALPRDGRPIKQCHDRDEAFSLITKEIRIVAEKLKQL